jgi:hypothetical protein
MDDDVVVEVVVRRRGGAVLVRLDAALISGGTISVPLGAPICLSDDRTLLALRVEADVNRRLVSREDTFEHWE